MSKLRARSVAQRVRQALQAAGVVHSRTASSTMMLEGRYTDDYLQRNGTDAPKFTDDELKTIASPLDFIGINVYYWAPHHVQSLWGAKSIFITENGCGASDVVADDGKVYDSDRIMFLRAYLTQLQRATADGVPVNGYFLWSAQDNFE